VREAKDLKAHSLQFVREAKDLKLPWSRGSQRSTLGAINAGGEGPQAPWL